MKSCQESRHDLSLDIFFALNSQNLISGKSQQPKPPCLVFVSFTPFANESQITVWAEL